MVKGKVLCLVNDLYIVELETKEIAQVYIGNMDNVFIIDKEKYIGEEYEFSVKDEINKNGIKYEMIRDNIQIDESVLGDLKIGAVIEVDRFHETRGGLIFDFNGIEGFVPKSEITHKYIRDLDNVAKDIDLNETKKAEIIEVKYKKGSNVEIVASLKNLEERAIDLFKEKNKENDVITAEVLEVKDMGLILILDEGITTLLHKNDMNEEMAESFNNMQKVDKVEVKIEKYNGDKILVTSNL